MKYLGILILFLPFSNFARYNSDLNLGPGFKDTLRLVYETSDDFRTPESVKYDNVNKILYVANINGNPGEKDGNGFISKLSAKGEIIQLHWVDGLNAPKGMGIFNNKLYVTDIDRLAEIDIATGKIINFYPAEGAIFLNDIDVDAQGNVYVSDMQTKKIWCLKNNLFEIWLDNEELKGPNGLYVNGNNLYIGCKGYILKVNTDTKQIETYAENTGSIDGLEQINENTFIFSDWSGHINILSPNKTLNLVLNTTDKEIQAADIEFYPQENLVFVPTFFHNTVSIYKFISKE